MKAAIASLVISLLFFACSSELEKNENHELALLEIKFEELWGKNSPASDSVKYALARMHGRNARILYSRAWKLASEKQLSRALKTADSLVMGYPAFDKGIYLRANLRLENHDSTGSLEDFERCLKKNPRFFECRMNRGSLFFSRNLPDLAYQDFREALRINPGSPEAKLNMGNAQYALGRPDSACFFWKNAAASGLKMGDEMAAKFCNPQP